MLTAFIWKYVVHAPGSPSARQARRLGRELRMVAGLLHSAVAVGAFVGGPAAFAGGAGGTSLPSGGRVAADQPLTPGGSGACEPSVPSVAASATYGQIEELGIGDAISALVASGSIDAVDLGDLPPPKLAGSLCEQLQGVMASPAPVTIAAKVGASPEDAMVIDPNNPPPGIAGVDFLASSMPQPVVSSQGPIQSLCASAVVATIVGEVGDASVLGLWIAGVDHTGSSYQLLLPLIDLGMLQAVEPSFLAAAPLFDGAAPAFEDFWTGLQDNPHVQVGPAAGPRDGADPPGGGCLIMKWECPDGGVAWAYATTDCCKQVDGDESCNDGVTRQIAAAKALRDITIAKALAKIAAIAVGLLVGIIACAAKSVGRGIIKKVNELEDAGQLGAPMLKNLGKELVTNPDVLLPLLGGAILELLVKQIAGPLSWAVMAFCIGAAIAGAAALIINEALNIAEAWARFKETVLRIKAAACGVAMPPSNPPTSPLHECLPS